jgi:hypothetical protein
VKLSIQPNERTYGALFAVLCHIELQKVRDLPENGIEFRVLKYQKPLSLWSQFRRIAIVLRQYHSRPADWIGAWTFLKRVRTFPVKEQSKR